MTDDQDDPEKTPVPAREPEPEAPRPRKGAQVLQLVGTLLGTASDGVPPPPDPSAADAPELPDLFDDPEQLLGPAHVGVQVRVALDVLVPIKGKLTSVGRIRPTFELLKDALSAHKLAVEHIDEYERLRGAEEDLVALLRAIDEALDDDEELPDGVREEHERIHRESRLSE